MHLTLTLALSLVAFSLISGCVTPYAMPPPKSDAIAAMRPSERTRFVGCADYPGGLEMLKADLEKSLQQGTECLAALGGKRAQDAARLAGAFDARTEQRPVSIFCGPRGTGTGRTVEGTFFIANEFAMAFPPSSPDFPGFHINLDQSTRQFSYAKRRALLFHEMLHWLDYLHGETFDVPYISGPCCFPDRGEKVSREDNAACTLLRDDPPFESEGYFRRFAAASKQGGFGHMHVSAAAFEASAHAKNGLYLMASVDELYGPRFDPMLGFVLAQAAKRAALPNDRDYIDRLYVATELDGTVTGPQRDFGILLGTLLGKALLDDRDGAHNLWAQIERAAPTVCASMPDEDRESLSPLGAITLGLIYERQIVPRHQLERYWGLCR